MIHYRVGIVNWNDVKRVMSRIPIILGDLVVVGICYSLAYFIRFHSEKFSQLFPITKGFPPFQDYLAVYPVVLITWFAAIYSQGAYSIIQYSALDEIVRMIRITIIGTFLAMSAMFLYRQSSFSRLVFVIGGFLSYGGLYFFREFLKFSYVSWIKRNKRPKRILLLGNSYLSVSLKKILEKHGDKAVLVAKKFDCDKVKKTIVRSRINEVLLAHPKMDHLDTVTLAQFCEERGIVFRLIPDILEIRMGEVIIDGSLGVPTFQIRPVSLQGTSFLVKRIMDVALSSILLGVFFIPLSLISILIKLSSNGSIFYKHERVGFKGRAFQFMKFRTMVQDADIQLAKLKEKSDRKGPVFKMKEDPRVTVIGKFLRRYSLDEIPQLINVLRGEMSLVGPRPQVLWEAAFYDEWAKKRLNVLPGITGLWQVSGRAELTYEEMIDLDIYYIEHWSPGLDIKIFLKTVPAILFAKGAY